QPVVAVVAAAAGRVVVQGRAAGQVGREVGGADAGGAAAHAGPALPGDVAQGRHPHVGVVPGGCQVDVDALGVEGGTGERHVVLPADEPAEPPEAGVDDLE